MKEVHGKIRFKKGTDWWKEAQKTVEEKAEEAAARAAASARKDVLDRAAKIEAENKAYLESIRYHDKVEFTNHVLRDAIKKVRMQIADINKSLSEKYDAQEELINQLREVCKHEEAIERQTNYKDEYDEWHNGHWERKCIECFLVEESTYHPHEKGPYTGSRRFNKLLNSKVVLLRKEVGDKEFELEFNDLTW